MNRNKDFHDFVMQDLFSDFPGVSSRAMFGGYGIYMDRVMFALIAEGSLYMRVDDSTRGEYEKRGSVPFIYSYPKSKKKIVFKYFALPEKIMEDREILSNWVLVAAAIARRDQKKSVKRGRS